MCRVAVVNRSGYYRSFAERCPGEEEMMVRAVVQKIVVEHRRRYGHRRVRFELNHELGMVVNYKRVLRMRRKDNLLARQQANDASSVISYPVSVVLGPNPSVKPVAGSARCWPSD